MESPQDNDTMPLKDGFNFTPMFNGVRVRMRISAGDLGLASRQRLGYRTWVTDLDTGLRYDVYGLGCGNPRCYCDAQIFQDPL
jgi:hypothetical protein